MLSEDHVANKLSDERFEKLSADYEAEQNEKAVNVGKLLAIVRRYTDIQELTPTLLREFVDKIVVHEADKSSGKRQQKIEIHYSFIGELAG